MRGTARLVAAKRLQLIIISWMQSGLNFNDGAADRERHPNRKALVFIRKMVTLKKFDHQQAHIADECRV